MHNSYSFSTVSTHFRRHLLRTNDEYIEMNYIRVHCLQIDATSGDCQSKTIFPMQKTKYFRQIIFYLLSCLSPPSSAELFHWIVCRLRTLNLCTHWTRLNPTHCRAASNRLSFLSLVLPHFNIYYSFLFRSLYLLQFKIWIIVRRTWNNIKEFKFIMHCIRIWKWKKMKTKNWRISLWKWKQICNMLVVVISMGHREPSQRKVRMRGRTWPLLLHK